MSRFAPLNCTNIHGKLEELKYTGGMENRKKKPSYNDFFVPGL